MTSLPVPLGLNYLQDVLRASKNLLNRLTPNDPYMGRTAPLTSKRCILYIYSTNIGTEYLKHALYSLFFFSSKCSLFHNANLFGSCIIHILYTGCAETKKKKKKSGAKGLTTYITLCMYNVETVKTKPENLCILDGVFNKKIQ